MSACSEAYDEDYSQWGMTDPKIVAVNGANATELERATAHCGTIASPNTITPSSYDQVLAATTSAAQQAGTYQPTPESLQCEGQLVDGGAHVAGPHLSLYLLAAFFVTMAFLFF